MFQTEYKEIIKKTEELRKFQPFFPKFFEEQIGRSLRVRTFQIFKYRYKNPMSEKTRQKIRVYLIKV